MNNFFPKIVDSLQKGDSIESITRDIKNNLANGDLDLSTIILEYLQYLNQHFHNKNNSNSFEIINNYLRGNYTLKEMSSRLFINQITIDHDKREGHSGQFYHHKNEAFLDKIFRIIYEFTRNDIKRPKGVCFDFCLFLFGLSVAKNDKNKFYIWNSIENKSGENNYILFGIDNNDIMVYDPFNRLYLSPFEYNLARAGGNLIEMNLEFVLKVDPHLGNLLNGIFYYEDILKGFKCSNKNKNSTDTTDFLEQQNYYDRLGISVNATEDEIKKAYRRAMNKYHPDKDQNDSSLTKKAQLINEAYDCLSNEKSRKQYDIKIGIDSKSSKKNTMTSPRKDKKYSNFSSTNNPFNIDVSLDHFLEKYGFSSIEEAIQFFNRTKPGTNPFLTQEHLYQPKINIDYETIISVNNDLEYKINNEKRMK